MLEGSEVVSGHVFFHMEEVGLQGVGYEASVHGNTNESHERD